MDTLTCGTSLWSQELRLLLAGEYGRKNGVDVCGRAGPGRPVGQAGVQPLSRHGNSGLATVGELQRRPFDAEARLQFLLPPIT